MPHFIRLSPVLHTSPMDIWFPSVIQVHDHFPPPTTHPKRCSSEGDFYPSWYFIGKLCQASDTDSTTQVDVFGNAIAWPIYHMAASTLLVDTLDFMKIAKIYNLVPKASWYFSWQGNSRANSRSRLRFSDTGRFLRKCHNMAYLPHERTIWRQSIRIYYH